MVDSIAVTHYDDILVAIAIRFSRLHCSFTMWPLPVAMRGIYIYVQ